MSETLPAEHHPEELMEALLAAELRFILIGGVHGVVRATRDIDIVPVVERPSEVLLDGAQRLRRFASNTIWLGPQGGRSGLVANAVTRARNHRDSNLAGLTRCRPVVERIRTDFGRGSVWPLT